MRDKSGIKYSIRALRGKLAMGTEAKKRKEKRRKGGRWREK
jgi:hypothetical protein